MCVHVLCQCMCYYHSIVCFCLSNVIYELPHGVHHEDGDADVHDHGDLADHAEDLRIYIYIYIYIFVMPIHYISLSLSLYV